ncbi:hypothetical protein HK407_01g01130 [Ordospora pajunii]|uniref:uncharacterized protein n=1 Tax=Ordospora pajunii TaxID=3039483 RepID=UPI0029528806|nr:uncharacterized protein HK407_01g01130 [Ordospora pajunii]KAH9412220.1 hypothetical protein HK407_01g01130 [Ordospora pajunii]
MELCIGVMATAIQIALLLAYTYSNRHARYLLYLPLNTVSLVSYFMLRSFATRHNLDLRAKVLLRIVKLYGWVVLMYTTVSVSAPEHDHGVFVVGTALLVADLIRAYLYESSKRSFENKILTGNFCDILRLEKYIVHSTEGSSAAELGEDMTSDRYFARGRPKAFAIDELFALWSDQSKCDENDSESDMKEASVQGQRRHGGKVSILPEMHEYPCRARDACAWNLEVIQKVDLTSDEVLAEKMQVRQPCEGIPTTTNESEPNVSAKDILLEIKKNTKKKKPCRPGLISPKSLAVHFGETHSQIMYRLIAFRRGDEMNYDMFKENGRQINGERANLFTTIADNKKLLNVVWATLVIIEIVVAYVIVFMYIKAQPLLLELAVPMIILPALPVIKMAVESFLFIVYTHPYDPGDRVHIDGENMIVREICLFNTTLERWDGMVVIMPNLVIREKAILNIRRSRSQQWKLSVLVSSKTCDRKIQILKDVIRTFVNEDRSYTTASVNVSEIINSSYIRLEIIVKHLMNFQSGFFMWSNHTKFVNMLLTALHMLDIRFNPLGKEIASAGIGAPLNTPVC